MKAAAVVKPGKGVPCYADCTMKKIALSLMLLVLAGCASTTRYPAYSYGGGLYQGSAFADSSQLQFAPGYDSLFLYGVYPWWTRNYYSAYYYPYRFTYYHPFYDPVWGPWAFAGWSPSWPYGMDYGYRYPWNSVAYRPWPVYLSPPLASGNPEPPVVNGPGGPTSPWIIDDARRRELDQRALARQQMYRVYPYGETATSPGPTKAAGLNSSRAPTAAYKAFPPPGSRASAPGGFALPSRPAPAAGIPGPSPRGPGIKRSRSVPGNSQRDY